jgi:hypothetical protein
MTAQTLTRDPPGDRSPEFRPVLLVVANRAVVVPIPIQQAAHVAFLRTNLRTRLQSTFASDLLGGADEPIPLLGGAILLDPNPDALERVRAWRVPHLPTSASGKELFLVTRDWMEAWRVEISSAPARRAREITLSKPFRTFSLFAWELLARSEQASCAARVGLDRAWVQDALVRPHQFDQMPAGVRLALATDLGVWNPDQLALVPPRPPSSFSRDELIALDQACEIDGWQEPDRILAMQLALRFKRERVSDARGSHLGQTIHAYRVMGELDAAHKWIKLMEEHLEASA